MYATLSSSSLFPTLSQNVTKTSAFKLHLTSFYSTNHLKSAGKRQLLLSNGCCCAARRQIRSYEDEDNDDQHDGYNEEIAILEFYTQLVKEEALLVNALVDDQQLQLLIFKGFSSSLSSGTCFDPTKSILPARAVIQSIDRVKGPFDPSNIDYIERNLQVEAFKTLVQKIKDVRSNVQS